jgi:hypothetical protein
MSTVTTAPAVSSASAVAQATRDRVFFSAMAVGLALTAFGGFSQTYYLRFLDEGPRATISGGPFTGLVHLHGALFTAWVLLFLVQTTLIAGRRVAVHRRIGIGGGVLAAAMVVVGTLTSLATARRGAAPVGVDPLAFLAIPLFDMVLFTTFVAAALSQRRKKEAHKRLMLLAYISIITAPIARLPWVSSQGPLVFFGLSFLFVIVAAMYDLATRRTIHRSYVWGGALIFASIPLRLAISGTAAWHALAAFMAG